MSKQDELGQNSPISSTIPFNFLQQTTHTNYGSKLFDINPKLKSDAKPSTKAKTIAWFHVVRLILFVILLIVYTLFATLYPTKSKHYLPISFFTGNFQNNNGAPFLEKNLIYQKYAIWIPLIILISVVFLLEIIPVIIYFVFKGDKMQAWNWFTQRWKNRKDNNNTKTTDDKYLLKTNKLELPEYYQDLIWMGIDLWGWLQYGLGTAIIMWLVAQTMGISNVVLLLMFSIVSFYIAILGHYTHEVLSGGLLLNLETLYSKESRNDFPYLMNWLPIVFGVILSLTLLAPFITYFILTQNILNNWFVWAFGLGLVTLIFIGNILPFLFYGYISDQKRRIVTGSVVENQKLGVRVVNAIYTYTLVKMTLFSIIVLAAIIIPLFYIFY